VPAPVPAPVDAARVGIVTDTLTFDEPPADEELPPRADELPPVAFARPMPPTEDEFELVAADEVDEVPMLFRLDPPPCPMPTDEDPEVEPDDELAVVSAWAACAAQSNAAQARCKAVLFIVVLRKRKGSAMNRRSLNTI
jgi:hypothetical protein